MLNSAGSRIAQLIVFNKPVNVRVEVRPFTDNFCQQNDANCEQPWSVVRPVYHSVHMNNGPLLQYPATVIRQQSNLLLPNEYDMTLILNSNADWYYSDEESEIPESIGNKIDFECIIV